MWIKKRDIFLFKNFFYLFGCVGSQLWHKGSVVVARGLTPHEFPEPTLNHWTTREVPFREPQFRRTLNSNCIFQQPLATGSQRVVHDRATEVNRQPRITAVVVQSLRHLQLFCNPMDCSPSGSSVHGISHTRIPGWVAIAFSRGSSEHRDQTWVSQGAQWKPCWLSGKESTDYAGEVDLNSGSGISPRGGNNFIILAGKIPQTEKAGGLQSIGLQRVRHE